MERFLKLQPRTGPSGPVYAHFDFGPGWRAAELLTIVDI
jgi:hypothetical protein